jgi:hypothetical protein
MTTFCIDFYESYLSTGRGERGGAVKRSRRRWGRKGEDICENENEKEEQGGQSTRRREDGKIRGGKQEKYIKKEAR